MAEGARLESVCTVYRTAGSNPALSVEVAYFGMENSNPKRVWEKDFPTSSG